MHNVTDLPNCKIHQKMKAEALAVQVMANNKDASNVDHEDEKKTDVGITIEPERIFDNLPTITNNETVETIMNNLNKPSTEYYPVLLLQKYGGGRISKIPMELRQPATTKEQLIDVLKCYAYKAVTTGTYGKINPLIEKLDKDQLIFEIIKANMIVQYIINLTLEDNDAAAIKNSNNGRHVNVQTIKDRRHKDGSFYDPNFIFPKIVHQVKIGFNFDREDVNFNLKVYNSVLINNFGYTQDYITNHLQSNEDKRFELKKIISLISTGIIFTKVINKCDLKPNEHADAILGQELSFQSKLKNLAISIRNNKNTYQDVNKYTFPNSLKYITTMSQCDEAVAQENRAKQQNEECFGTVIVLTWCLSFLGYITLFIYLVTSDLVRKYFLAHGCCMLYVCSILVCDGRGSWIRTTRTNVCRFICRYLCGVYLCRIDVCIVYTNFTSSFHWCHCFFGNCCVNFCKYSQDCL